MVGGLDWWHWEHGYGEMEGAVYIVIKVTLWFNRYAFSFHLMVANDKSRSMIGIAFQIGENKNGKMCCSGDEGKLVYY